LQAIGKKVILLYKEAKRYTQANICAAYGGANGFQRCTGLPRVARQQGQKCGKTAHCQTSAIACGSARDAPITMRCAYILWPRRDRHAAIANPAHTAMARL